MENNETKNSIVRMFGKVPEAMLIINNSIYCDEETDGLFHHEMGITDSLFSTERINDYIIRRPYPNKQVCQVSKKIGRNEHHENRNSLRRNAGSQWQHDICFR